MGQKFTPSIEGETNILVHLDGGFEKNNFKVLGKLFLEAMSNLGVKHVPVLAAEDETAILGQISYSERTDELLRSVESPE